jgi:hypothetical protein
VHREEIAEHIAKKRAQPDKADSHTSVRQRTDAAVILVHRHLQPTCAPPRRSYLMTTRSLAPYRERLSTASGASAAVRCRFRSYFRSPKPSKRQSLTANRSWCETWTVLPKSSKRSYAHVSLSSPQLRERKRLRYNDGANQKKRLEATCRATHLRIFLGRSER